MPVISVIIPAHNADAYVDDAIRSALDAQGTVAEVIVIDDASTDATGERITAYGDRIVALRHLRRRGVSAARNTGLTRATGDYVVFLDADDWFPPTFLADALAVIEPGEALCYDSIIVDPAQPDGARVTLFSRARPWRQEIINKSNVDVMFLSGPLLKSVVRRDDALAVGGFDEDLKIGEDFHFHVKLVAHGLRLRLVERPMAFYRLHGAQATAATSVGPSLQIVPHLHSCDDWIRIYERLGQDTRLPASVRASVARVERYWRYRYVRAALLAAARRAQVAPPLGGAFLSRVPAAAEYVFVRRLPAVAKYAFLRR